MKLIEDLKVQNMSRVAPSRGRGLKRVCLCREHQMALVAPSRGRGLKLKVRP